VNGKRIQSIQFAISEKLSKACRWLKTISMQSLETQAPENRGNEEQLSDQHEEAQNLRSKGA